MGRASQPISTPFGMTENHRTIRAELTVLFQPFQLHEFPVMRTLVVPAANFAMTEMVTSGQISIH